MLYKPQDLITHFLDAMVEIRFLIGLTLMAGALVTLEGGQIRMEEFQAMLPERSAER